MTSATRFRVGRLSGILLAVGIASLVPATAWAVNPPAARAPGATPTPLINGANATVQVPIVIAGGGGPSQPAPTEAYFSYFANLYDGDYQGALQLFQQALASGIKIGQNRWIDSICYYTMVGECHYHLGHYAEAVENYNAALRLYLCYPNWMVQVEWPPDVRVVNSRPSTPWGRSARGAKPGDIARYVTIMQGSLNAGAAFQTGGPVVPMKGYQLGALEVVRCTTLAIKRRAELMGPVCPQDHLTDDVLRALAARPGPANRWCDAWLDLELATAYVAAGQSGQATGLLQRSLLIDGQWDHRLAGLALLELGQIKLENGEYAAASNFFEEASYSAVLFPDNGILEEAFRYGQLAHLAAGRSGIFAPLATAVPWSKTVGRELHASLLLLLAENHAVLEHTNLALQVVDEARKTIQRRDMLNREIGARLNYVTALADYQKGNISAGDDAIAAALAYQKNGGSKWLYQIFLADNYVTGKALGAHRALGLYQQLLRDPTGVDWLLRPLDSLAVLSRPHSEVYEHWFETTLQSGDDLKLEVADRAKRHRFLSTLPLGGRLMALRWVLEAPAESVDPVVMVERQNLLTKFPAYDGYAKQVRQLRADLGAAPLAPDKPEEQRKQADKLAELSRVSQLQENLLRQIALRREAADLVFPPIRSTRDVQNALAPRQLMLVFFTTSHHTHAWLMSRERYAYWKIEAPAQVEKRMTTLLRALGNIDANHDIAQDRLGDEIWHPAARDLSDALLAGSKVNLSDNIDELLVIPDGMLWYLPFEALTVPRNKADKKADKKDVVPLITKTRVRYLPTMGLAVPDGRVRKPNADMGIVLGKIHPHDDAAALQDEMATLQKALPHAVAIKGALPAASPVYASLFDGLVVYDDLGAAPGTEKGAGHYDWAPLPLDRGKAAGSLLQWFALPWKAPTELILPGFHTAAESALKQNPNGNEMFLSVCGLMSTGTRTILLSRWRTSGQTSYELIHQFVQELPYASAAEAWQRSVQLLMDEPLDLTRVPRVKASPNGASITGRNPFFWSGFMLVDTGWAPTKEEPPAPQIIRPKAKPASPVAAEK